MSQLKPSYEIRRYRQRELSSDLMAQLTELEVGYMEHGVSAGFEPAFAVIAKAMRERSWYANYKSEAKHGTLVIATDLTNGVPIGIVSAGTAKVQKSQIPKQFAVTHGRGTEAPGVFLSHFAVAERFTGSGIGHRLIDTALYSFDPKTVPFTDVLHEDHETRAVLQDIGFRTAEGEIGYSRLIARSVADIAMRYDVERQLEANELHAMLTGLDR